jgi:DNA helicase-2/ATP-dependent DNA helicase PcrA
MFRPSRDLAARRATYYGTGASGLPDDATQSPAFSLGERTSGVVSRRPVVPGERMYRDGDRVRHAKFGVGTVVSSKLTRDDEEVTVAFPENGVKRLLASLANLEPVG